MNIFNNNIEKIFNINLWNAKKIDLKENLVYEHSGANENILAVFIDSSTSVKKVMPIVNELFKKAQVYIFQGKYNQNTFYSYLKSYKIKNALIDKQINVKIEENHNGSQFITIDCELLLNANYKKQVFLNAHSISDFNS